MQLFFGFMIAYDLLHLSNDSLESLWVVYSEVSENLTVDLDTSLMQSTHQSIISHILEAGSSVDTLNPQRTESTLLVAAIAVSIGKTLLPSVLGYGPYVLTRSIVTTCKL